MTTRLARLAAVLLPVAAAVVVGDARAAHAECVEVNAYVTREDEPWWYPLGGPRECVLPTPWDHRANPHLGHDQDYPPGVPGCLPDGFFVRVWVPMP
ncbi:MAG TPA: hypothetical protein VHF47_11075 [Acidimicrobiales bacterium]|nr:hypothetical protein [Acidimicrobiales bacterium]